VSGLNLPKLFQNPQYLAQVGHFLGGAWVIGLTVIFAGFASFWIAWIALVVLAAIKEGWYDIKYEKDSWPDSVMDFAFYQVGAAVASAVFWLAHHLHRIQ
jgi:hypothetical protein